MSDSLSNATVLLDLLTSSTFAEYELRLTSRLQRSARHCGDEVSTKDGNVCPASSYSNLFCAEATVSSSSSKMSWKRRRTDNGPGYYNIDMDKADNCVV